MTKSKPAILIATKNAGKLAEFERLLGDFFSIEGLDGLALPLPEEGVESYQSNAETKATFVAGHTGRLVLGDDSGIEVNALVGKPGIVSARFAGEPVSDERNIDKLLTELSQVEPTERSARFVCWLALAGPNGLIASVDGICTRQIGVEPRGENGFGYDPIFVLPTGRTMAELSDPEKDEVSHRGNAIRRMLPTLMTASSEINGYE